MGLILAQFQIDTNWHQDSLIPSVALIDTSAELPAPASPTSFAKPILSYGLVQKSPRQLQEAYARIAVACPKTGDVSRLTPWLSISFTRTRVA